LCYACFSALLDPKPSHSSPCPALLPVWAFLKHFKAFKACPIIPAPAFFKMFQYLVFFAYVRFFHFLTLSLAIHRLALLSCLFGHF